MNDFLPKNPLIFDIGANSGRKTARYLKLGASRVVTVEPQASCLEVLNAKYSNNSKVSIEPFCLSDVKGPICFYENYNNTLSSADLDWQKGRFQKEHWKSKPIEIQAITLDDLITKYGRPDFCKIDVEGFELNVLRGLSQPIPFLSFEFASEYMEKKTRPCLQYLQRLGYKNFNAAFGDTERFAYEHWMDADSLLEEMKKNPDAWHWGDIYARI